MTATTLAPDHTEHASPHPAPPPLADGATHDPLAERTLARRAVEAAIWGMPIVAVDAMREAFFRDAAARYNDIVFWSKPCDWRSQLTTPDVSAYYAYFPFNTANGPVVLELPAVAGAGLFGTLLDAWQVPLVDVGPHGVDEGRGGRFVLLPPDHQGEIPEGHAVRCPTYNGYALFRAVPAPGAEGDAMSAVALVKRMRLYPLARAASPPPQRFVDMADRLLDGIVRYDASFYARLARIVGEEPVQPRDRVMMGQLRSLGIEKGKPFAPDERVRATLEAAIEEAHAGFIDALTDGLRPWWPGTHWGLSRATAVAAGTHFSFETPDCVDVDARAPTFFHSFAPPAALRQASAHLMAFRDAEGEPLRGGAPYTLRVPPKVPVEHSWTVAAYDLGTASFVRASPSVGLDSRNEYLARNPDGSVDLHFGAIAPTGRKGNWIYTAPGRGWFAMFRFHGPDTPLFEKRWQLPDIAPCGA